MTKEDYLNIIAAMRGKRMCVIGDMVLDKYLDGRISRISREAPVLVLNYAGEKKVAGGAANVVHNVVALGGRSSAVGLLGDDADAVDLKKILATAGADVDGLVGEKKRFTASKTRIIAGARATVSQQIVRIDKESSALMDEGTRKKILHYLKNDALGTAEGVILSDYGAGFITDEILRTAIEGAKSRNVPIIVDSRYDINRFKGVNYIKQNESELAAAVGRDLETKADLVTAGRELVGNLSADGILLTRGELGMLLVLKDGNVYDIPVLDKSEVFDVSGAGDTCVAVFMLALAAGAEPKEAAQLSNIAAQVAVRKLGTSTVSAAELKQAVGKFIALREGSEVGHGETDTR